MNREIITNNLINSFDYTSTRQRKANTSYIP